MLEIFDRTELELLRHTLSMWHQDRVLLGAKDQADVIRKLIERLIQEIEKQKGSSNDH